MKDVITLLSNIAGYMEILKRDQAHCLLQFVLAFAPKPQSQPMTWDHAPARHPYQQHDGDNDDAADGVNVETEDRKEDDMDDVDDDLEGRQLAPADKSDNIVFATYEPAVHPYLPLAVDCLAKLLALGDPHRMHFESVLRGQADSPTRFWMLSRAFGLAMAAIPNLGKDSDRVPAPVQIDMRTTSIMQALLAGDILTSLAPGHEYGLVRSWLASPSGIAQNLNRLIQELMLMFEMRPRQVALSRNSMVREEPDLPATLLMIKRALAMLANLLAKARDPKNPGAEPLPPGAVISEACALHALNMKPDMWVKEGALSMLLQCVDLDR
jgi:SWI/SNF chromatin-remodeling complex subunit SWI1